MLTEEQIQAYVKEKAGKDFESQESYELGYDELDESVLAKIDDDKMIGDTAMTHVGELIGSEGLLYAVIVNNNDEIIFTGFLDQ